MFRKLVYTGKVEKTSTIIPLEVASVYDMCFSFYSEIKGNSTEIGLSAQFLAKLLLNIVIFHCVRSLL